MKTAGPNELPKCNSGTTLSKSLPKSNPCETSPTSTSTASITSSSGILKEVPISPADIDAEDVIFYGKLIGIDPFLEPHLLWIAQAGLVAPLPVGWFAVEDHRNRLYYYNWATGKSSWEHPNDGHYRRLVKRYRKKIEKRRRLAENKEAAKWPKSRAVSPSSIGTASNLTDTMSGISSTTNLGNLHFFEDDEDDEVFKDLLKPRNTRGSAKVVFNEPAKTSNSKSTLETAAPSKLLPPKEDSIESVEFDLEGNSNEDEESIASLEALQSGSEVKKKSDNGGDKKELPKGKLAAKSDDIKGKDDSDDSDHWNSLPDNELDPFADLFQSKSSDSSVTNFHSQRPMSAKVRPVSAVEQQNDLTRNNVTQQHLRKPLSILEEEENDDDEEEVIEEDEDIEEVYEDEALEEVNEVEEDDVFQVISNKVPATTKSGDSSAQMSQAGRIKGAGITQINAQINGAHLLSDEDDAAANRRLLNVANDLGKSNQSAEQRKYTSTTVVGTVENESDDFESEEEVKLTPEKKMNVSGKIVEVSEFEKLGRRLEEEIASLKASFRGEISASKSDLLSTITTDFDGRILKLKTEVDTDNIRGDIRFLTERLDKLWTSLGTLEKTFQEEKDSRRLNEQESFSKASDSFELEKLLEKALNERKKLDEKETQKKMEKMLEEKLTAVEVESGRQVSLLKDELYSQLERQKKDLNAQFEHEISKSGESLRNSVRASLAERMEQRLSEQFRKQEHILFEQRRTDSSGSEQVTEAKLQQIEEERKVDKIMLGDRLDRLQARIDAVMGEIDGKLSRQMDEQNNSASKSKSNSQQEIDLVSSIKGNRKFENNRSNNKTRSEETVSEAEMSHQNNVKSGHEEKVSQEAVKGKNKPMNAINGNTSDSQSDNSARLIRQNEDSRIRRKMRAKSADGRPIIVQQCKELQKALHECALQLNDRIRELKLNDDDDESNSDQSVGKKGEQCSANESHSDDRKTRQKINIFNEREENEAKHSRFQHNATNYQQFANSTLPEFAQPANRSLSKSTPNLCHHCQHQHTQEHNTSSPYLYIPKTSSDYFMQGPPFELPLSNFEKYHHHHHRHCQVSSQPTRSERKLQSIRSSSKALIEQIKSTGSALRAELENLQRPQAEGIFSGGLEHQQLLILNARGRLRPTSDNQARIFFDGDSLLTKGTDESLIRQLRSIRSTVNDRLAKMALVIEQQKTTQI